MRITPLAVWTSSLSTLEEVRTAVVNDVEFTHPNVLVHDAVFIYCKAIHYLLLNPSDK